MPTTRSISKSRGERAEVQSPMLTDNTGSATINATTGDTETTQTDQEERSNSTVVTARSDRSQRAMSVRSLRSSGNRREQLELRLEAARKRKEAAEASEKMVRIQLELLQLDEEDEEEDVDQTANTENWVQDATQERLSPDRESPIVRQQKHEVSQATHASQELANALILAINQRDSKAVAPPKYLHELPYYDGNSGEWLAFKTVYEDTAPMFSEVQNMARLRRALRGAARETVKSVLYSEATPEQVIKELRQRYGRPSTLALEEMERVKKLPMLGDGANEVCVFASQLSNCVAAIRGLKRPQYLLSPETLKIVVDKLPPVLRYRWYDFVAEREEADPSDLGIISKFMNREAERCSVHPVTESTERRNRATGLQRQRVHTATDETPTNEGNLERCPHCDENHTLLDCKRFLQAAKPERWKIAKGGRVCFKCLTSRHRREDCRKPPCKVCNRQHHLLLHEERSEKSVSVKPEDGTSETVSNVIHTASGTRAYLKMIPIEIFGPRGKANVLALLDEGSTVSLLDAEVAATIGATGPTRELALETIGGKKLLEHSSMILDLELRGIHQEGKRKIRGVRTIDNINLKSQRVKEETLVNCKHLEKIAKQLTYEDERPRMLIGQDNWELIVSRYTRKGKTHQPVASYTSLGWVLHGCDGRPAREVCVERCAHLATAKGKSEAIVKEHKSKGKYMKTQHQPDTDYIKKVTRKAFKREEKVGHTVTVTSHKSSVAPPDGASQAGNKIDVYRATERDPTWKRNRKAKKISPREKIVSSRSTSAEIKLPRCDRGRKRNQHRLDVREEDDQQRLRGRSGVAPVVGNGFKKPVILSEKCVTVRDDIRQRYWNPGLQSAVSDVAHRCQWCRVRRVIPAKRSMGGPPPERFRHGVHPYTCAVVDNIGPMTTAVGRRHKKK